MSRLSSPAFRYSLLAALGLAGVVLVLNAAGLNAQQPVFDRPGALAATLPGNGPQLGVTVRDVRPEDASALQLPAQAGAIVETVRDGSPAAAGGLAVDDVVLSFDGETIRGARQLSRLVQETPAEKPVAVTVMRGGIRRELTLTPAPASDAASLFFNGAFAGDAPVASVLRGAPSRVSPDITVFAAPGPGRLGVRVQNLAGDLGEYFGVDGGALVTAVTTGSPAAAAGLRAGDVITAWDGEDVASSADVSRRALAATGSVALTIVRNREAQTLRVELPGRPVPVRRYGM